MVRKIKINNKESFVVVILCCIAILYFHFTLPRYKCFGFTKEFEWDILSYYLYLPLTFIKGDILIKDYSYIQYLFDHYHFSPSFYQAVQAENGNFVMIYTMGLALLQMPFFFIGHLWANISGHLTDGFSFPYQFFVSTGMMFYILLGVFVARKVLLNFFNDRVSAITLFLILMGTNYFREATDYNMGPHAILFTLYSLLIYFVIKWHKTLKIKFAIGVGITIGFLTLSRPTELICVFIPIFWNVWDRNSLNDKIILLRTKWHHVLGLIVAVFLVGLPQMIYWKYLTGSWFYNSYWNQQSFDISESHLLKILFSFRKGWFVYSPLIILAFLGILMLFKKEYRSMRFSVLVFIVSNIFIISHVPIWWNAGSFGQRFMVQSYAVLALPFAVTVNFLMNRESFVKFLCGFIFLFFVTLNIFQSWQFVNWIIPGDGITKEFYFRSLFKTQMSEEDRSYLELQRTFDNTQKFEIENYRSRFIGYFDMEKVNTGYVDSLGLDTVHFFSGINSFKLSKERRFSPTFKIPFYKITQKDHAWIKVSVHFFCEEKISPKDASIVVHFFNNNKPYNYYESPVFQEGSKVDEWNFVSCYYLTPSVFSENNELCTYVWNKGDNEIFIDDITVEAFEKK